MGNWYQCTINMRNLPRLGKTPKEPVLDPVATMNQQAGTGIWHHDALKKAQQKQNKKGVQKCNINW